MGAIELDGAYNVRDLGGLPTVEDARTRDGLLYRGDSLDALTGPDQDCLFRELGVGVVIDLRSQPEVAPAAWRDTVRYYQFPLISGEKIGKEKFPDGIPAELGKLYLDNLEEGGEAVRATFGALAEHLSAGTPCVVHCAAGRDRTGVIVAVLLSLLGVTDEAIALDYSASNRNAGQVQRKLAQNPLYANGPVRAGRAPIAMPEVISVFLGLLRDTYGGAEGYAAQAGLDSALIKTLRAALLGPPPASVPAGPAPVP